MIYKQDVGEYRRVIRPLVELPGVDGLVVERLFSLLGETSGLLMAAVENIRFVKDAGLLKKLFSNDEKVRFLQMREDLRDGFRR